MAAKFWVGGSGNWDATTTTNWSTSSGGIGGAAVPTSSDDVTFDANSGTAATVTITAAANANSITINKSDLTLTHNAGSTVVGIVTLTTGTLNTNGQTCAWGSFISNNSNTRALSLGASAISLSFPGTAPITSSAAAWDTTTTTGLTFTAGTSSITFNGTGTAGAAAIMNAGSLTYSSVIFAVTGTFQFSYLNGNSPTFANLTVTGQNTLSAVFSLGTNITVTTALVMNGNSANTNRLLVNSTAIGTTHTITNNGSGMFSNLDLQDITGAGTASWNLSAITGGSGDCLGNSGITFTTARSLFWVGNSSSWSVANKWSLTTGGTANQSNPLPQDTITFDANSFNATGQTVTCNMPRMGKSVNFTGVTNSPTLTVNAGSPATARIFGSLTLVSSMSQTGTSVFQFENRDGATTLTTGGNTFTNGVKVNSPGGTVTLSGDLNTTSSSGVTLSAGTFTVTTNNATTKTFLSSGTITRVLNMGSGTWTLNNTGFVWNLAGSGLTVNAGTSTIVVNETSTTSKTFAGLGQTYNILTVSGDNVTISANNTFNTLNINNAGLPTGLKIAQSSTQTITNALTTNGSSGNLAILASALSGTAATLSKTSGIVSVNYMSIKDSHATGGAQWYAGSQIYNVSNNTGWIFESPPNPRIGWGIPIQ